LEARISFRQTFYRDLDAARFRCCEWVQSWDVIRLHRSRLIYWLTPLHVSPRVRDFAESAQSVWCPSIYFTHIIQTFSFPRPCNKELSILSDQCLGLQYRPRDVSIKTRESEDSYERNIMLLANIPKKRGDDKSREFLWKWEEADPLPDPISNFQLWYMNRDGCLFWRMNRHQRLWNDQIGDELLRPKRSTRKQREWTRPR